MAFQALKMKKFPDKWIDWVMKTISGGKVAFMVNGEIEPYFKTHQGLRQGDSMSPLLFDHAVDNLAILFDKAVEKGLISGLAKNHKDNDVSILQYVDDTILLFLDDLDQARNVKRILTLCLDVSIGELYIVLV